MLDHILPAFQNGDLTSLASAGIGAALGGAWGKIKEYFEDENPWENAKKWAKDFFDDYVPAATTAQEVKERVEELYENLKTLGEEVFPDIADTVRDALDTGEITPTAEDGHLGETHDIMTPDSEVPFDVGTLPGVNVGGGGMSRDTGGEGYSGDFGGGTGGDYDGGTTPLGLSSPETPATPADGVLGQPTHEDLGLDPNTYFEYQPSEGQVVIQYPDGTTETRPWPPR